MLGVAESRLGNLDEALSLLTDVTGTNPNLFEAQYWLSVSSRAAGDQSQALQAALRAVALKPGDSRALVQLGLCHTDLRRLPEAESAFRSAMDADPSAVPVDFFLSRCLQLQGRISEAKEILDSAILKLPSVEEPLVRYSQSLLSQENWIAAQAVAGLAVRLFPNSWKAHLSLGRAFLEDNRAAEGAEQLRQAVKLSPGNAEIHSLLGTALQSLGHFQEAAAQFQRALELDPMHAYAHFSVFQNRKATVDDRSSMTDMRRLAEDGRLGPPQLSNLHYGLAKAHEDLGEYGDAMSHYDEANRIQYSLKFRGRPFNRKAYADRTNQITSVFTSDLIEGSQGIGNNRDLPIFVVGMMRSGTTLVEQILSSHPEVGAAGELSFWPDNWRELLTSDGVGIDSEGIRRVSRRYLELLQEIAPGARKFVDKMLTNYFGLGMLRIAFPAAKVVHIRRHPVDTCLSIYATPNRANIEFIHDRSNIVFGYREYQRLMDYWRSILPSEALLDVDYEDLVTESERVSRKIVEFCELPWSDDCLRPQDNRRTVITPSVWQVRQPLYKTSIERWRKYEPWLGEFSELL